MANKIDDKARAIGTVKMGNRVIALIVSSDSDGMFQAALDGLLHKPIYVTAVPVIFALYQGGAGITYEKPD